MAEFSYVERMHAIFGKPRTCRVCGCTNNRACVDAQGIACHWVEPDLCSACRPSGADAAVAAAIDVHEADPLAPNVRALEFSLALAAAFAGGEIRIPRAWVVEKFAPRGLLRVRGVGGDRVITWTPIANGGGQD